VFDTQHEAGYACALTAPSGFLDHTFVGTTDDLVGTDEPLGSSNVVLVATVALSTTERIALACGSAEPGAEARFSKIVAVKVTNLH
jgi:hypothetical protein